MYKPCKLSEVPTKREFKSVALNDLMDFMESSYQAGEVRIPEGKNVKSQQSTYSSAAKKLKLPIIVMQRGKRLFMVKEAALRSTSPESRK